MQREVNIDFLRVVTCILVVIIHISAPIVTNSDSNSNFYLINLGIDSFSRIAVPLFVMITGRYLINPNSSFDIYKYRKNIHKIFRPLIMWTIIYTSIYIVYKLFKKEEIDYKIIFENIIQGKSYYHLWYLYMILGLYIIIPFLNKTLELVNIKHIKFLTWFFVLFALLHQTYNFCYKVDDFFGIWFIDYIGYALLGYIYKNKRFKYKYIFIGGYILTGFFIYIVSLLLFPKINSLPLFNYNSLFVIFGSLFIYRFFDNIDVKNKLFIKLADNSFGIYLIHPLFILVFSKFMKISIMTEFITLLLVLIMSYISVSILSKNIFIKKYLF